MKHCFPAAAKEGRIPPVDNQNGNIAGKIEAILFVSGEAVSIRRLAAALKLDVPVVRREIEALRELYDAGQRGFVIKEFGEMVQLATRAAYSEDVVRMLQPIQQQTLSQSAMETLAVVAYRQPVTRAEIEQIRGVKCDYSLQALMQKGLILETGRKDTVGRPILYGTSDEFLSHFGLKDLSCLPPLPQEAQDTVHETEEELIP